MITVAVAGGTRGMGLAIVQELKRFPNLYTTKVLSRSSSKTWADTHGVTVVSVDYENIQSLKDVLEAEHVHTLISNVFVSDGIGKAQHNLIRAADASSSTERFIPSTFDVPYDDEMADILYTGRYKLEMEQTLMQAKSIEWTRIHNGFFLDYFFSDKISTFLTPGKYVIDLASKKAIIPGDGNTRVCFTHTFDVARFVVAALSLPHWPSRLYIAGDAITWNRFVDLAEEMSESTFEREYNSLDDLKSGDITRFKQLDGWEVLYEFWPKRMAERLPSAIQYFMGSGSADILGHGNTLNQLFPSINALTIKEALRIYYHGMNSSNWKGLETK